MGRLNAAGTGVNRHADPAQHWPDGTLGRDYGDRRVAWRLRDVQGSLVATAAGPAVTSPTCSASPCRRYSTAT